LPLLRFLSVIREMQTEAKIFPESRLRDAPLPAAVRNRCGGGAFEGFGHPGKAIRR
jgi:hypothetical protein